ncbi:OmpA family protein [Gilvimarinus sp. SDUM040013]|uniref:OmpA family protein n=1 Tax=Gilvimarinus gilvus TaxID=3058038 RepID=A0ABU4RX16_9GAMM|nr:OmpA family protein [Gilvimarinus sp. SDUM040013]MDO3386847.1 OmpA family protein [Gilvimarinus sp. SDUM040013]MDX6848223.1 OmpA family protein [Gilvimarinus sp. SDUM040013]
MSYKNVFALSFALILTAGCSHYHIGMWVAEDGAVPDADQDGVADDRDDCIKTPLQTPVDERGCVIDDDSDGVANLLDLCPGTPPDTVVDNEGCPVEQDSDVAIDASDNCRDGVEADGKDCDLKSGEDDPFAGADDALSDCRAVWESGDNARWGCAELSAMLPSLSNVHFSLDSWELMPEAFPLLEQVVMLLQAQPEILLRVIGYTDNQGSEEYNMELSRQRAQTVVEYLVARGIDPTRLEAHGRGEAEAVASNADQSGRSQNRRVEFVAGYRRL